MSELINNREHRQELLKEVIKELHEGKSVQEVKEKFASVIEGTSPIEISQMEVALVKEGLPIEEIQYLCDVHAEVFKGTLEEIHHPDQVPGHPIYTFKKENEALTKLIDEDLKGHLDAFLKDDSKENILDIMGDINLLWDIDKHYSRKENLIFPYLEKYGVTAPPKVMWGVDDEIRAKLKEIKLSLKAYTGNKDKIAEDINAATHQIKEMIFKEENILFPMALDTLTEDEWISIYHDSEEIGYAIIVPDEEWKLMRVDLVKEDQKESLSLDGNIRFETGILSHKELNLILNNIPGDFTFVDKDGLVKYFSNSKDRFFARTKAIIGRTVENCHPPASVHVVEDIVNSFKSGEKDSETFWINMGGKFVVIQYFALRDENGEYMGVLEFSHDATEVRQLEGEKRLMSK